MNAVDDTVYVRADSPEDVLDVIDAHFGKIPRSLLSIEEVDELPEGEETIN